MLKYLMTFVAVFGVLTLGACKQEETSGTNGTAETKEATPAGSGTEAKKEEAASTDMSDAAGGGTEAKKEVTAAESGMNPTAGRYVDAP